MNAQKELDTRGLNCPLPILKAKKALAEMESGEVLKVVATDPGSVRDFQAFARQTGNELGDKFWLAANKVATDASFGARQTLFAASQDLPGNTFVGPKFGFRGPTGPTQLIKPAGRSARTATALWDLSAQLTSTEFPL